MDEGLPVVHPTDTELSIWAHLKPKKTGGLVRTRAHVFKDCADWDDFYREPEASNPEDWESKLLAGFRGEWFAHVLEDCERILDVGCGFGFPAFYLARYGSEVVGIDSSASEIETATEIAGRMDPSPRISFEVVGEGRLPFADQSFDGAALSTSLECALDPTNLLTEVKRVLRPGSPLAIQEEDRSLEPLSHPVWEKLRWAFFDDGAWLWYEVRVHSPYLDRRYMLRMNMDGSVGTRLKPFVPSVLDRKEGLPVLDFNHVNIPLESALSEALDGEWSQSEGYDPGRLKQLLTSMGFSDIRFWLLPDGRRLAHSLERKGLLLEVPLDVRGVIRSVLDSMQATEVPVSCTASCRRA